jgi:hypothetical protein
MYQQRVLRKPDCWWATFPQSLQPFPDTFATQLAVFLNRMGDTMREVCRISGSGLPRKKRWWSSAYAQESLPIPGHCVAAYPALVLFDNKPEDDEEGWNNALSMAELVYSDDYDSATSLHRLVHDASDTFFNQDDRRFQVGLTFAARIVRLVLIDHSGVVTSESFNRRTARPACAVNRGFNVLEPPFDWLRHNHNDLKKWSAPNQSRGGHL